MIIPRRHQAEAFLIEGGSRNPGPWIDHSRCVAKTAEIIAYHHPEIDPQPAYILGLLHDIGRREGSFGMRHVVDGYQFLIKEGFPDAARICLTHSYPLPNVMAGSSNWDGTQEEENFVSQFLFQASYNLYDQLIQLCDSICLPVGPVLMEKRLVDVTIRYGFNAYTLEKWKAFFVIKQNFEIAIGGSIYAILPDVFQNTFND